MCASTSAFVVPKSNTDITSSGIALEAIILKVSAILFHLTHGINPNMKLAESAGFRSETSQRSRSSREPRMVQDTTNFSARMSRRETVGTACVRVVESGSLTRDACLRSCSHTPLV